MPSSGEISSPPSATNCRTTSPHARGPAAGSGSSITSSLRMVSHISRAVSYWPKTYMAPFKQPTLVPVTAPAVHPSSSSARQTPT